MMRRERAHAWASVRRPSGIVPRFFIAAGLATWNGATGSRTASGASAAAASNRRSSSPCKKRWWTAARRRSSRANATGTFLMVSVTVMEPLWFHFRCRSTDLWDRNPCEPIGRIDARLDSGRFVMVLSRGQVTSGRDRRLHCRTAIHNVVAQCTILAVCVPEEDHDHERDPEPVPSQRLSVAPLLMQTSATFFQCISRFIRCIKPRPMTGLLINLRPLLALGLCTAKR